MRPSHLALALAVAALALAPRAGAEGKAKTDAAPKPWCAPEVTELSDHVCYFDGGVPDDKRRTLVVYLHGALAQTPGFQYLQQRAMAFHAKRHSFTVVMPTGPSDGVGYVWPTSQKDIEAKEPAIIAGITKAKADLEKKLGVKYDETFVVGFSSGAYYGSSLAVRSAIDVDGYIVLAGGSSWVKSATGKRAPVFVGVSAADPSTAGHSRSFAGTLAGLGWPYKVEERNAGHMVDWTFMSHGIAWLRSKKTVKIASAE